MPRMDHRLPPAARWLGPAGLLPFAGLALASLAGWAWAAPALAAYGATILAFLGAVHWGLALRAPAEEAWADWPRLGLGVVPALLAWIALLLPTGPGLALIAAGILLTFGIEAMAALRGLVPRGYLRLRAVLSIVAALCLTVAAIAG